MSGSRNLSDSDLYVRRYTSRRQRRRLVRNVILVLIAVLGTAFYWNTRDNRPMARLVPKDPAYQLCATDLLLNRKEIAASRVWELAPADSPAPKVRAALAGDFGLPEWILNNLAYGIGLVSGGDLRDYDDAIFVTRISRIGCGLEWLRGFANGIDDDDAGGLALRHVKDADTYYAIRGRVLVASRSRDALVHALTLREDEALSDADLVAAQAAADGRNLLAIIRPAEGDPLGAQFERVELTFALTRDAVQLDSRAVPRAQFAPELAAIFGPAKGSLPQPAEGLVEIAVDLGRPFTEVWPALSLAFPGNPALQAVRGALEQVATGAGERAPMLEKVVASLGSGVSFSWTGVDLHEMLPAPQVLLQIDAPQAAGYEVLAKAGLPREMILAEDKVGPYYDEAAKLAIYPAFGGPSMHPSVGFRNKKILISSSATLARDFYAGKVPLADDGAQGHAIVRVRVAPAVGTALDVGQELADSGLIKGYDADSFRAFASGWRGRAALIGDLTGLLAYSGDTLQFRVTLSMAAPGADSPVPQEAAPVDTPTPAGA